MVLLNCCPGAGGIYPGYIEGYEVSTFVIIGLLVIIVYFFRNKHTKLKGGNPRSESYLNRDVLMQARKREPEIAFSYFRIKFSEAFLWVMWVGYVALLFVLFAAILQFFGS